MHVRQDPLLTPRFLTMCAYSFTVFVSLFQLLPTAPYHVLDLGGTTAAAGLFLGFLTYASAFSAPLTGSIGDRFGQRRVLVIVSLVLSVCTAAYAVIHDYRLLLAAVLVHGLFWSALLSASGAYMAATVPDSRRAEGLGYWGLASVLAIAVAPPLGFWVYRLGWPALCAEITALNVLMALIAWRLPHEDRSIDRSVNRSIDQLGDRSVDGPRIAPVAVRFVEWRVLLLSISLSLVSFGYGSLTSFSALFADELGVAPRSLFLTIMAGAILVGRLALGRRIDDLGHRRVLMPCLAIPAVGLLLLALSSGPAAFLGAAAVFGLGFGLMYPAFVAYVIHHVAPNRRGAAFGAILAAFDTGIGTGSTVLGWLIHDFGFRPAYAVAAGLAALSLPYFVTAERRLGFKDPL